MRCRPRCRFRRRAGRELGDGERAGLVDEERQAAHFLAVVEQPAEIGLANVATPYFRLFGEHAGGKLFRRHFQ
jgi:hypothetical protein